MRVSTHVLASAFVALTFFTSACSDSSPTAVPDGAAAVGTRAATAVSSTPSPIVSSLASTACADVYKESTQDGAPVVLWSCNGGSNQQYAWQTNGSVTVYGSKCLTTSSRGRNGEKVTISTCNGSAGQQWKLTDAKEITGVKGKCLTAQNASSANGTALVITSCDGSAAQKWNVPASTGTTTTPAPDTSGTTTPAPAPDTTTAPAPAPDTTTTPTPTPTPTPTGSYVTLTPGQSIQAAVDANPTGTQFLLKAGTYHGQHVVPKSGDTFTGEAGAILDGDGSTQYAFDKSDSHPSNVTIQGLIIQNYNPDLQLGAILAGAHGASDGASGWVVQNCEIRYNSTAGIRLGTEMKVLNNKIHHNGQIGIVGIGDNVLVEGNEISYNNYNKTYDYGFEAGGTKFVKTNNLIVRNNFSHHNYGPGLWTDIDNYNTLYEGNRVEDNADAGIFHEISYKATIRNNTVQRNGFVSVAWLYGAGIFVSSSRDVEVYGNTVTDNANGITAVQQSRGSGSMGDHITQNVYVHDNNVKMSSGRTGMAQDVNDQSMFTSRNNRYASNHYTLGGSSNYFEWMDGQMNESKWQSYGQDTNGSFQR